MSPISSFWSRCGTSAVPFCDASPRIVSPDRSDHFRRDDDQRHGQHRNSAHYECDHDGAVRPRGGGGGVAGVFRDLELEVDQLADGIGYRIDALIELVQDETVKGGAVSVVEDRQEFGDMLVGDPHPGLGLRRKGSFLPVDLGGAIRLPMLMQVFRAISHLGGRLGKSEIAVARLV